MVTVRQLSQADTYFLVEERPGFPMVIGALMVVDTCGASPQEAFCQLSEHVASVLPATGLLKVLRDGREGMVWDNAEYYSSQHHIHAVRECLPFPSPVAGLIEGIAVEAMDLDRPPFAIWIIEDMGEDKAGLIIRVHHGFADGAAFLSILQRLTTSGGAAISAGGDIGRPPWQLLDRPPGAGRAGRTDTAGSGRRASAEGRSYSLASFPFSALHRVAGRWGGTVNVLLLTLLAEAIRGIFDTSGTPLPEHIVVRVAANMRDPEEDTPGNRIAPIDLYLRTDISSVTERFASLQPALSGAASAARAGGSATLLDVPGMPKLSFTGVLGWPTARFLGGFPVLHNFPIPMLTPHRILSMGLRRCGSALDVGLMTRGTGGFGSEDILARLSSAVDQVLAAGEGPQLRSTVDDQHQFI